MRVLQWSTSHVHFERILGAARLWTWQERGLTRRVVERRRQNAPGLVIFLVDLRHVYYQRQARLMQHFQARIARSTRRRAAEGHRAQHSYAARAYRQRQQHTHKHQQRAPAAQHVQHVEQWRQQRPRQKRRRRRRQRCRGRREDREQRFGLITPAIAAVSSPSCPRSDICSPWRPTRRPLPIRGSRCSSSRAGSRT